MAWGLQHHTRRISHLWWVYWQFCCLKQLPGTIENAVVYPAKAVRHVCCHDHSCGHCLPMKPLPCSMAVSMLLVALPGKAQNPLHILPSA